MTINFYLKEDGVIDEDSVTISLIRKGSRSQAVNVKKLDDLTAIEQQTIKAVIVMVEKYRGESEGAKDLKYGL